MCATLWYDQSDSWESNTDVRQKKVVEFLGGEKKQTKQQHRQSLKDVVWHIRVKTFSNRYS